MEKGDQLCILRAEVKTDADALNLLRLVAALATLGIPLDSDCPYLETRELIDGRERRMESADVIRIVDAAVAERETAPDFIRSDNGPEFIAADVPAWVLDRGFKTLYIAPGSPWENPYSESFNSRFQDEFLNRESFVSLLEAKVRGKEHRHDYNHRRLHSSLDYQPPAEFAQRCLAAASATPVAARQRPPHRPHHHQPTTRTQIKSFIASGSNFGGSPTFRADNY